MMNYHSNVKQTLDSFKLYYEEMERKVPNTAVRISELKTPEKKSTVVPKSVEKSSVFSKISQLKSKVFNRKPKRKITPSLSKRAQVEQRKARRGEVFRGIIGIGLLLAVVSIARSTFIALQFVDGVANVVYLIPQVIAAVVVSIIAFVKIYK